MRIAWPRASPFLRGAPSLRGLAIGRGCARCRGTGLLLVQPTGHPHDLASRSCLRGAAASGGHDLRDDTSTPEVEPIPWRDGVDDRARDHHRAVPAGAI